MTMLERPSELPRRGTPRPAPDAGVDPIDAAPPAGSSTAPTAAPPAPPPAGASSSSVPAAAKKGRGATSSTTASADKKKLTPRGRPRREETYPWSNRFRPETIELIDTTAVTEGITVREVVETAINGYWGSKGTRERS